LYQDRIELIFDAGHRQYDYHGKCESPHGHTFRAEIFVRSDGLNPLGFVVDFVEMKDKLGQWVDENWDHAFLVNERDAEMVDALNSLSDKRIFLFPGNPSSENMARTLFQQARHILGGIVCAARIWESPSQYAEYAEDRAQGA
jgi:6-pyruvoyltetrahydropterin/6-carboxytetrahydropterin synthase